MKKILVPTDFSDQSKIALDFAAELAKKAKAVIKLIHVFEYPVATTYAAMDVGGVDILQGEDLREKMAENKARLDSLVEEVGAPGILIEKDIKVGNPFVNISSELKQEDVDMVVMGTRGTSGIEEVFIGSNTEKVVRHAKCPVISLKERISVDDIKSIVFASNFKDEEPNLVDHLKKLQTLFNADIHFVRVNTPSNFEPDSNSKKRIKIWLKDKGFERDTFSIHNDVTEEDGIIHFAEEIGSDMIAMGTHSRSFLGRLLGGSLAEDVVNHARRPIWTYHIR